MATYAEMFGGGSGKNYVRLTQEDEQFVGIFEGYERIPDINFKTKKARFMVQEEDGGKWGPQDEGSFDPDAVHKAFPLTQVELHLTLEGKDWYWTLSGTAEDAFKSALKAVGGIEDGDTVAGKLVSTTEKPYTWKFKIVRQGT